ncbi:MAG: HipA domain-containing protein [Christensenellaceae bacterium]|jgi:hypothetical protein|nr:HipA domain-containing protein [Christensenellaceae bacterium]
MTTPKNIFNEKPIRAQYSIERAEWLFAAIDVLSALAEQTSYNHARKNWNVLKTRNGQLSTNCGQLKLLAADGKKYMTDVLNKAGVLALASLQKYANVDALMEWLSRYGKSEKKYILKHKDIDVVEIELNDAGEIAVIGKVLNEAHLPVGTVISCGVDTAELQKWWSGRSIPASREMLNEVLVSQGLVLPQQLLEKNSGLSLSDQYWICTKDADIKWASINYFDNNFSEDVGDMLFGRAISKSDGVINLSSPDNTSDGMLKKKWKIVDGKRCLIKGSSKPFHQEVANEVLAARICERLDISFVNYWVVDIDGEKYSACEDFITGDTELVSAWRVAKQLKPDSNTSAYEAFIRKAEEFGITDARRKIDMMLTLDFIIVNVDRHYNNFGFVRDANTLEWLDIAPIFDSGNSMWYTDLHTNINPMDLHFESKAFNKKLQQQIKHIKDFSWLNLDALDGIEDIYAEVLERAIPASAKIIERNNKLCAALRKRIEFLRGIITKRQTQE